MSTSIQDLIRHAARKAYIDVHTLEGNPQWLMSQRQLDWRAADSLSRDGAACVLLECVPGGYNAFEADLLKKLPSDCRVTIAREGSVCIYVDGNIPKIPSMNADEWSFDGKETRIWWD